MQIARRPGGLAPGDELVLQIEPADMGRIRVELRFTPDGGLEALVSADQPRVLDQLRAHSADLHRSLLEAGGRGDIAPPRFEVRPDSGLGTPASGSSFGQAASGGGGSQQQGQAQHGARAHFPYPHDPSPAGAGERYRLPLAPGRLDLLA